MNCFYWSNEAVLYLVDLDIVIKLVDKPADTDLYFIIFYQQHFHNKYKAISIHKVPAGRTVSEEPLFFYDKRIEPSDRKIDSIRWDVIREIPGIGTPFYDDLVPTNTPYWKRNYYLYSAATPVLDSIERKYDGNLIKKSELPKYFEEKIKQEAIEFSDEDMAKIKKILNEMNFR